MLSSLRFRLVLLLFAALLPLSALLTISARDEYQHASIMVESEAQQLARLGASHIDRLAAGAHQLLAAITRLPEVRAGETEACNRLLADLLAQYAMYANLGAFDAQGQPICSALPYPPGVHAEDRMWFQRSLESESFALGDYQIGRITGVSVLVFGYPILDKGGQPVGVAFAALDLAWLDQAIAGISLPEDFTLTVLDGDGIVLARYPDTGDQIGLQLDDPAILEAVRSGGETILRDTLDLDGTRQLFALAPADEPAQGRLYVAAGIPTEIALTPAKQAMQLELAFLLVVTGAALALAWSGGDWLLLRPTRALAEVARRLGAGELGARAELGSYPQEIDDLAQALNEMATALEARQREAQQLTEDALTMHRQLEALLSSAPLILFSTDPQGAITFAAGAGMSRFGIDPKALIGQPYHAFLPQDQFPPERFRLALQGEETFSVVRTDDSVLEVRYAPMKDEMGDVVGIIGVALDITDREKALQQERESEARYATILESAADAIITIDEQQQILDFNHGAEVIFGYQAHEVRGKPLDMLLPEGLAETHRSHVREFARSPETSRTMSERRALSARRKDGSTFPAEVSISKLVTEGGMTFTAILRDVTARVEAERQIIRQLERLDALRAIDMAITASLDLRVTLNVFLEQVINQLGVDAAAVLLMDPHLQIMEFATERGFHTEALRHTRLRIGEGHAGRAAQERRTLFIPDLRRDRGGLSRSPLFDQEGFVSYFAVPLISKARVRGVLEIFHRSHLHCDQEWIDFLETLATQAAIAIDNATLFDDLQRSHTNLTQAYDATLEGWSRALDLRDHETEGHTQRVTELSLRLARAVGIGNSDLVHLRRGALLHDIGKVGIPDSILHKPGPLTEEQWDVMHRHPFLAYEMLAPIAYLRPALDIPYCHHEKWDGSGYPRGLKGEQIPLAARVFAVVDVWDALRSDRPYRPAWSEEEALEYLHEQSGKHFDPRVVKTFLEMDWRLS